MKRGGPLKTYSPLKRSGPIKRTKPMSKAAKAKRRKENQLARDIANVQSGYWEKKAKGVWRPAVVIICEGRCAVCGKTEGLEAHHMISVARCLTRWNPMNGLLLCSQHHRLSTTMSGHRGQALLYSDMCLTLPERVKWLQILKPQLYNSDKLKSWDYKADYLLSSAIVAEHRNYRWLCNQLGLAPEGECI